MPDINGVKVTTELEVKLITALSDLYKMSYYYFKKSSTASVETQAKRSLAICNLLDSIRKEFNPPVEEPTESTIPTIPLDDEEGTGADTPVDPDNEKEVDNSEASS